MKCIKSRFGPVPGWNGIEVEKLVAWGVGDIVPTSRRIDGAGWRQPYVMGSFAHARSCQRSAGRHLHEQPEIVETLAPVSAGNGHRADDQRAVRVEERDRSHLGGSIRALGDP
jgi:hypothetical protein